jgi:hypothetical protein
MTPAQYDVLAFAAHPDDLEAVMGGIGVRYAEAFKARSPLLVADPEAFGASRFG